MKRLISLAAAGLLAASLCSCAVATPPEATVLPEATATPVVTTAPTATPTAVPTETPAPTPAVDVEACKQLYAAYAQAQDAYFAESTQGAALADLDFDGVPELLLVSGDAEPVVTAYGIENGEVVSLGEGNLGWSGTGFGELAAYQDGEEARWYLRGWYEGDGWYGYISDFAPGEDGKFGWRVRLLTHSEWNADGSGLAYYLSSRDGGEEQRSEDRSEYENWFSGMKLVESVTFPEYPYGEKDLVQIILALE